MFMARMERDSGKSLFIGRDKEINEIIEDVKSNKDFCW
jgi:hypothetical protein